MVIATKRHKRRKIKGLGAEGKARFPSYVIPLFAGGVLNRARRAHLPLIISNSQLTINNSTPPFRGYHLIIGYQGKLTNLPAFHCKKMRKLLKLSYDRK